MDRIVFKMPTRLYEYLIAMAVIQEFQMQLIIGIEKKQRDSNYTTTFRMKDNFAYLIPCLKVINEHTPEYDYSGWDEYYRGDFDCFIEFDFYKAENVVSANKRHITEGFGLLLGTLTGAIQYGVMPQRQPILRPLNLPVPNKNNPVKIGIMEWDVVKNHGKKLKEYINNNYPEFVVDYCLRVPDPSPEEAVTYVNQYDVYIGLYNDYSYIAAALGKMLIEIFPTEAQYYLYGNDNLDLYKVAIGNPSAQFAWLLWEELWHDNLEHMSGMNHQDPAIQMDSNQSTADNVEEKLADTSNP